jgi:acyl-CoA dehydrogenase
MSIILYITGLIALYITGLMVLGFFSAKFPYWIIWTALALAYVSAPTWLYIVLGVPALVFLLPVLRQRIVTAPLMKMIKAMGLLPVISKTEREALDAGTVWYE